MALVPYAEKLVSDHLREDPDLSAITTRIVGKSPSSTSIPWVRLTQLDAAAVNGHRSDHLIEFYCQFDCYAGAEGGQPEANLLARTVRQALVRMPDAEHDGAVVTGVDIQGQARLPDTDVDEPARERFTITAAIWIHNG